MDTSLTTKLQELIRQGEKLAPEGGLEFSGYNAKMQSQYLLWRKNCLESIGKTGDKGAALRAQLAGDENGAYFYQSSAQKVLDAAKEAVKFADPVAAPPPPPPPAKHPTDPEVKKAPEPVKAEAQKSQPPKAASISTNRVFVVSAANNPLMGQLVALLKELGIEASVYQRTGGSDALISNVEKQQIPQYAFYLVGADDIPSVMFELGYLVGKFGANRVCCVHQKDVQVPKNIAGVQRKEITVKLEEVSFSLIKELKAAGYSVTF